MSYTGTTAAILSNYDEALKIFYLPAIQEQLNHGTILSDLIDTNEEDVSGKSITINCHYGRTKGTGARKDGGQLPEADYQKFKTCVVPTKYNYGRVTFSGPTIAATRDAKGAYARVVDEEIMGVTRDLQREINRQLWGCGYGVLARWLSTSTTVTYYLQKKYRGNSAGGDGFGSTFGGKYVEENGAMVPAVLTVSTSVIITITVGGTDMTVTAVDSTTNTSKDLMTITTNPSVSEAAGTYYVRPGSVITTSASKAAGYARDEMMGIRGIATNTDIDQIAIYNGSQTGFTTNDPLQSLDTSSYPWWKSQVDVHASGRYGGQRALTLKKIQQMFDKTERAAGKDYGPDLMITTQSLRREYLELMRADRRHVNTMTLDGGWTALDYNGIPLTVDEYDAIDGEIYYLTTKDLAIYRMSDYDWMAKDGAILSRIIGYDAYEAVLFRYAELGARRRNSQGVLCDLSYDPDR